MKMISKQKGFTIIELVVVFPIVAIVIGTLLVVLVNLVADNSTTKTKSELTYSAQSALDMIERDITYATDFLTVKDSSVVDPYVSDAPGGAWSFTGASSNIRTLILRSYETTNPAGSSVQQLVRPQDIECSTPVTNPISYNIIYFVKDGNLYRRTLTDTSHAVRCSSPYQKQSCPADLSSPNAACQVEDALVAKNVTSFQIDYYSSPEDSSSVDVYSYPNYTSLEPVTSAKITLTLDKSVASENVSVNRSLKVAKLNSSAFTSIDDRLVDCPDNFALVPGNPLFGTSDFCVAKYETKILGNSNGAQTYSSSFVPESRASGTPWVYISQPDAAAESRTACPGCHLITESEWLTIAHDLLGVSSNWSGGSIGSGYIYSGHSDGTPANSLAASSNDNNGYSGTGNSSGSQRRTLTLSNGEVIWDFSGNVYEWVDKTINSAQPGFSGETTSSWKDWNSSLLSLQTVPASILPSYATPAASSWTSSHGLGQLFSGYNVSALRGYLRGGSWASGIAPAGIFSLTIGTHPSGEIISVGFRMAR